jgi:hypothetical protein
MENNISLKVSKDTSESQPQKREDNWKKMIDFLDFHCPYFAFIAPPISLLIFECIAIILDKNHITVLRDLPGDVAFTLWVILSYLMIPCKHRIFKVFSWGGFGCIIGLLFSAALIPLLSFAFQYAFIFLWMCLSSFFTYLLCRWQRLKRGEKTCLKDLITGI